MIALDTNVLLRALVDDPDSPQQCRAVRARLSDETQAFIPQIVQAELVWALTGTYGLDKAQLIAVLGELRDNTAYCLEMPTRFANALNAYTQGTADFADYLLLAAVREQGGPLLTFDKRLARSPDVTALAH